MSTVFVTLCDKTYFSKACRTIGELKTNGQWKGDIVLLAIDFYPSPLDGVLIWNVGHIDTTTLVHQLHEHPIQPMDDNRHFGKLYQWDKLRIFSDHFKKWERVVFLDAGIRVFDSVQPLLDVDWRGKFLAPDDSDPYDNGNRFCSQLDLKANSEAVQRLFQEYPETILNEHYFLNCIFMFDTSIIDENMLPSMIEDMNKFPICMCNEMGIMNLWMTFRLRVWQPFPQKVNNKYLFGWCERNYREGPDYTSFHFLKYSITG